MGNVEAHCRNGGLNELEAVLLTEIDESCSLPNVVLGGAWLKGVGGQLLLSSLL